MAKYALLVGLKEVDPAAYRGWDGKSGCEGCEKDVQNIQHILSQYQFEPENITSLLTASATREQLKRNLTLAASTCKAGDLFVFYYSGHGGQVKDHNGDEIDEKDETLVCYDGELIDDELNDIWVTFQAGVRLVMITDCCNSESNNRSALTVTRTNQSAEIGDIAAKLTERSDMQAMMIHIGACSDGEVALGYKNGGLFTQAIKKILGKNAFSGTYRALVDAILEHTSDFDQKANYSEYGPTDHSEFNLFRNGKLFEANPHALTHRNHFTLFTNSESITPLTTKTLPIAHLRKL